MRVLVVGSGGREHALAWKIAQSPRCDRLWCAPGNPGIAAVADCLPIGSDDLEGIIHWAAAERPDLVVIGPEAPLVAGLADRLRAAGIAVFGPSASASIIEGSKPYAKALMRARGVPTADFQAFTDWEAARAYLDAAETAGRRAVVVKASGLAAGKGAVVCDSIPVARDVAHAMLVEGAWGAAGREIVIEEYLEGEEASLIAVTDGRARVHCPPAQDHKRVGEGDRGPMTGGMGAYAPAPAVSPDLRAAAGETIFDPVIRGLEDDGRPYSGCLFAGLMLTGAGPRVLEFNCRFGDPEAQVLLPLLESDLLALLHAAATGGLTGEEPEWSPLSALCVVICAHGYPQSYSTGHPIDGLEEVAAMPDVLAFHAGTKEQAGRTMTAGGRVLNVVGLGDTLVEAARRAYAAVDRIRFEGAFCRRDIGWRALKTPALGVHREGEAPAEPSGASSGSDG